MLLYVNHIFREDTEEVELQNIYNLLTSINTDDEKINTNAVRHIIAWLPSIRKIEVYIDLDDDSFINVFFVNGEMIQFDNTGIERKLFYFVR